MVDTPVQIFTLEEAARAFFHASSTQDAQHIRPLHRYVAARLVIEGGFLPTDILPRPPLEASYRNGNWYLAFNPSKATDVESVVLGGLKSKRIDVVVTKDRVGPVLAVSVKGTGKAFRNLVNRTEEAIGDCANIHLMYPGLVFGFLHVLRAIDPSDKSLRPNDASLDVAGQVVPAIRAYAKLLASLSGRRLLRNDFARYEAAGLALLSESGYYGRVDLNTQPFPLPGSPLALDVCFKTLYEIYDLRFPYTYTDPSLKTLQRVEWHPESEVLKVFHTAPENTASSGYLPRIGQT